MDRSLVRQWLYQYNICRILFYLRNFYFFCRLYGIQDSNLYMELLTKKGKSWTYLYLLICFIPFRSAGSLQNMLWFIPLVCLTLWSILLAYSFRKRYNFLFDQELPAEKEVCSSVQSILWESSDTFTWRN